MFYEIYSNRARYRAWPVTPTRSFMLKQLIRTKIGLFCLSWIIATSFCLMMSVRWRTEDRESLRTILAAHDGFVLVFWHERILAMPWLLASAMP